MIRILWILMFLGAVPVHAGEDELKQDAQLTFQKGQKYYEQKNWPAAVAMFEAARNLSPGSSGPYAWLGLSHAAAGDCTKAVPYFEEYLRRQKTNPKPDAVQALQACRAKQAPPAPPPLDPLDQAVVNAAREGGPPLQRVGEFFRGAGKMAKGAEMHDQYALLDARKCYVLATAGGPGVTSLYLYLWDTNNKRIDSSRKTGPTKRFEFCPTVSGRYHYQVKFASGEGPFSAAVFAK